MKTQRIMTALCAVSVLAPALVRADENNGVLLAQGTGNRPAANKPAAKPATAAGLAAEVNGEKIAMADVERAASVLTESDPALRSGSDAAKAALNNIRQQHLENLITQTLLAQAARKRNLIPPKAEVDKAMAALQQGITPQEFQKSPAEDGKTVEDVRSMITDDLAIRELTKTITRDVTVTEAEIQAVYRGETAQWTTPATARASHILLAFKEGMTSAQKTQLLAKAKEILKQAKSPSANFAELAKKYSEDPGSKEQGGDLGDFDRERMVKEFADAVWANPVGAVVGPVESEFGYHIIRVTGKKPAAVVPLDFEAEGTSVRAIIRARLLRSKMQNKLEAHLKTLRAAATIKKFM